MLLTTLDRIAAGLPLHIQDDCWRLIHPGGLRAVLYSIDNVGDIRQHHRGAITIRHNYFGDSPYS